MPLVKISGKRLLTIPIKVFKEMGLEIGDYVEFNVENGKGTITPKRLVEKPATPKLTKQEQRTLAVAEKKISAIANDKLNSRGLTKTEIKIATKAGLIDPDQAYYWTEGWQKGMRDAEQDIKADRVSKKYDNIEEALEDLKAAKV